MHSMLVMVGRGRQYMLQLPCYIAVDTGALVNGRLVVLRNMLACLDRRNHQPSRCRSTAQLGRLIAAVLETWVA